MGAANQAVASRPRSGRPRRKRRRSGGNEMRELAVTGEYFRTSGIVAQGFVEIGRGAPAL